MSKRQVRNVVGALTLGLLLSAVDQTIVTTAMKTIGDQLGGLTLQAWVLTAYLVTSTISTLLYGKLSDAYGRKQLYLVAISLFIVGSTACSFATSMYQLTAFRALQGLGAGGLFPLAEAMLSDILPARERARYQGYFAAVFGSSSLFGPLVGGFFAGSDRILGLAGWRWIFLVNVPLGAIALLVIARLVLPRATAASQRIDVWGAVALSLLVIPLLIVTQEGQGWGWTSDRARLCYTLGGIGFLMFLAVESHMKRDALLPLHFFRNRTFTLSALGGLLIGACMVGAISITPVYMQVVSGATPIEAGLKLLPLTVGMMLSSVLSGEVINRTGRLSILPPIGSALMVVSLALLATLDADTAYWKVGLYVGLAGFGLGFASQPLTLGILNAVDPSNLGAASSSAVLFQQVGSSVGAAAFFSLLFGSAGGTIRESYLNARAAPPFTQALAQLAQERTPDMRLVLGMVRGNADAYAAALNNTSFLTRISPALARPFREGFTQSTAQVFLVTASVMGIALVVLLFLPKVPLRAMSAMAAADATSVIGAEALTPSGGLDLRSPLPDASSGHGRALRTADGLNHLVSPPVVSPPAVDVPGRGYDHPTDAYPSPVPSWFTPIRTADPDSAGIDSAGMDSAGIDSAGIDSAGMDSAGIGIGPSRAITGYILGPDGRPVAGAAVSLTEIGGMQVATALSGDDGSYRLVAPSDGSFQLDCYYPAFHPATWVTTIASSEQRHDIFLVGSARIAGVVTSVRGVPIAGVTVTLIDAQGEPAGVTTTGPDGDYALENLCAGAYTLTATAPGVSRSAWAITIDRSGHNAVNLMVERVGILAGTVLTAGAGVPVPYAYVTAINSSGAVAGTVMSDTQGFYELPNLPLGEYTLLTSGSIPVVSQAELDAREAHHDVTFDPHARQGDHLGAGRGTAAPHGDNNGSGGRPGGRGRHRA